MSSFNTKVPILEFNVGDEVEVTEGGEWKRGTISERVTNKFATNYNVQFNDGVIKLINPNRIRRLQVTMPEAAADRTAMEVEEPRAAIVRLVAAAASVAVPGPPAVMSYRSCDNFGFTLDFLKKCEGLRQQMWQTVPGDLSGTCGYTGPGIGILLLIFERNNISDNNTLAIFLQKNAEIYGPTLVDARGRFMAVVNETIGNFLDLCDITPVTQTQHGTMGIIKEEEARARVGQYKVSLVNNSNLVKGANVISFKNRGYGTCTFHHSMIYVTSELDMCFILDSWFDNYTKTCRKPSCRQFTFSEVSQALVILNSGSCPQSVARNIFFKYFKAPDTFLYHIGINETFYVYVLNQEYVKKIYTICEHNMIGNFKTDFGGSIRKKKKIKTKKLYKKTYVRTKKPHAKRYIRTKKLRTRRQIRAK